MNEYFEGSDLETCLEEAEKKLNMKREDIKYEIVEKKSFLFKKHVKISVSCSTIDKDGKVCIKEGKIYIQDPVADGSPAHITSCNGCKLIVNEKEIKEAYLQKKDAVRIEFDSEHPSRILNIKVSKDNMQVFITIEYNEGYTLKLKDHGWSSQIVLEAEKNEVQKPPIYKVQEIKEELTRKGITYGIIEENIKKFVADGCTNALAANGDPRQDGVDDKIEVNFNVDNDVKKLHESKNGNVDFKSIGVVGSVEKGKLLAKLVHGSDGKDGKDIYGNVIKHKPGKKLKIVAENGAELKDNGESAYSTISGKPGISNAKVFVNEVYPINGDVDIKTGNINFIGAVNINGNIKEGMQVASGDSVDIKGECIGAEVKAKYNVTISDNVISSEIYAGGEDTTIVQIVNSIKEISKQCELIMEAVEEVKNINTNADIKDGEIIKLLIEKKFKSVEPLCRKVASLSLKIGLNIDSYVRTISYKLIGFGPLSIKFFGELKDIKKAGDEIAEELKKQLKLPGYIKLSYIQNSTAQSTGDIVIGGTGEYVSKINSNSGIYFTSENSLARGGVMTAGKEIKCRTVGSTSGTPTSLIIDGKGDIYADVMYQNTKIIISGKEQTIDEPSKNVHAYLNDELDLVVEKLKM